MGPSGLHGKAQAAQQRMGMYLAPILTEPQTVHEPPHNAVAAVDYCYGTLVAAAAEQLPQMVLTAQEQGAAPVGGAISSANR